MMKPKRSPSILIFAGLALCCSTALAQNYFTSVQGDVLTCTVKTYSKTNTKPIEDQVADSCPDGSAASGSSASLIAFNTASANAQNGAGASALGRSSQAATLIPPKGFTGTTVKISYKYGYYMKLSGVGPGTGTVEACISFIEDGSRMCQSSKVNGTHEGTIDGEADVKKLPVSGFKVSVVKQVYVEAAGNAPPPPTEPEVKADAMDSAWHGLLILPKGWKCTWQSGAPCP